LVVADEYFYCGPITHLTLPPGWTGSYTCPALRLYQLSPMPVPECNHKVTGSGFSRSRK